MSSNLEKNEGGTSCEYQENLNILRQIDFFSGLPLEATKVFAYLCSRELFKQGDYLFLQDDEDGRAYYVISGSARLVHRANGNETTIRDYHEGEFIGRLALMGRMRRLFTLQAINAVTCLTIDRAKFTKALGQFPEQMPKIIKVLVDNIYNWEKRFIANRTGDCEDCMQKVGVSLV